MIYDPFNPIFCSECHLVIKNGRMFSDGGAEESLRLRKIGLTEKEIAREQIKFKYFHEFCCPDKYKK